MKLHPSLILVKASTFPLRGVVRGRSSSNEDRENINSAMEGVDNWP